MGNCCGCNSTHVQKKNIELSDKAAYLKSDSIKEKSISKHLIVLCLDVSPTVESSRLKTLLRGSLDEFASFNGEHRLLNQIVSTEGYRYLIIIGKVKSTTLQELVNASNVVAIYLCLGLPQADGIPQSRKIKGIFENDNDLKQAIEKDLSLQ